MDDDDVSMAEETIQDDIVNRAGYEDDAPTEHRRLYLVTLKGLHGITGSNYQASYVVATDPTSAYEKVREYLDKHDIGFPRDRAMDSIKTVADTNPYGGCDTLFFM
jgi:hypothetical protein